MTTELMRDLLTNDEKITIEYKTCQRGIQEDVYETVCSFSNRYGGYIIMGVEDDGTPIGINRNMSKDMRKNFVNQLNNSDRMSPTLYLSIEEFEYEGKLLLWKDIVCKIIILAVQTGCQRIVLCKTVRLVGTALMILLFINMQTICLLQWLMFRCRNSLEHFLFRRVCLVELFFRSFVNHFVEREVVADESVSRTNCPASIYQ